MTVRVGVAEGKCPVCGRVYIASRPAMPVLCDCYKLCPICTPAWTVPMTLYQPDLTPQTYGKDAKHDLNILYVCYNHSPPYYSTQKAVEVELQ